MSLKQFQLKLQDAILSPHSKVTDRAVGFKTVRQGADFFIKSYRRSHWSKVFSVFEMTFPTLVKIFGPEKTKKLVTRYVHFYPLKGYRPYEDLGQFPKFISKLGLKKASVIAEWDWQVRELAQRGWLRETILNPAVNLRSDWKGDPACRIRLSEKCFLMKSWAYPERFKNEKFRSRKNVFFLNYFGAKLQTIKLTKSEYLFLNGLTKPTTYRGCQTLIANCSLSFDQGLTLLQKLTRRELLTINS